MLMIILCLVLIVAVVTDMLTRKIPNMLVLFGLISSLILQAWLGLGSLAWLQGVVVAFVCFIPLYMLRGMAAGDVKLMMAVGGFVAYPLILKVAINVVIAGGLLALLLVLFKGKLAQLTGNLRTMAWAFIIKKTSGVSTLDGSIDNSVGRMPFAPSIALGTFYTLWHSGALMLKN